MKNLNVVDDNYTEAPQGVPPVQFTDSALGQFRKFLSEEGPDATIRIGVQGGGCSGYQYTLNAAGSQVDPEEDIVWTVADIKFVTDIFSEVYLRGCEIDYIETLAESGFKFNNPNAKRGCGCGSSFST